MKFSVNAPEFKHAISVASKISSSASIGPLTNILMEVSGSIMRITSSNYVSSAITEIAVKSDFDERQKICVPHKVIMDIVSSVCSDNDEDIVMTIDDKALKINKGRKRFSATLLDHDLFPEIKLPDTTPGSGIAMTSKLFSSAMTFGVGGSDDTAVLPYQKSVRIRIKDDQLELTSTDSKRLFIATLECDVKDFTESVIASTQAKDIAAIAKKYDKIEMFSVGNFMVFRMENMIIGVLKIDVKFPNVEKIQEACRACTSSVNAKSKDVKQAIKDAEIFSKETGHMIVDFQKDQIVFASSNVEKGSGDVSVEAVQKGEELSGMLLNTKYIQAFFNNSEVTDDTMVTIKYKDKRMPIWMWSGTENMEMNAYVMTMTVG